MEVRRAIPATHSTYRSAMPWRTTGLTGGTTAATRFILEGGLLQAGSDGAPRAVAYLDPADWAVAGLTTRYRVRAVLLTNDTALHAVAITLTVGLYPITASSGAANVIAMTAGTVQSGSTVAFVDPAASSQNQGNSGDFTAPAAGYYAFGLVNSDTTAANSDAVIAACLQVRNT